MKRFNRLIRALFIYILGMTTLSTTKAAASDVIAYMDSVEFSLVTCSPHEEIYSLYGHTALRMRDMHKGQPGDVVYNWGVFNFDAPHFVLRFVFGLTDYELEAANFNVFCEYYRYQGSSVTEQVLDLTSEEKVKLCQALAENCRPENKVYRYNYFYDNCSTRPRDMIERCINGKVDYEPRQGYEPSFREMIREMTRNHDWATFGNDMLLGVKADLKTSRKEQEFLPENLLYDFDHAQIRGNDGSWRPLVKERRMAVNPGVQVIERDFPLSPFDCSILLLLLSLSIIVMEWRYRKIFRYWDAGLMLLTGLAGCVLFVMIFSQHPTTSLNLQLLLVNPIHLFYIPSVLRGRKTRYWMVLTVMVCLFYLGAIWQHYAEGMMVLALCLLLRFWIHYKNEK